MSLRFFGAGTARVRSCPACEQTIQVDATFCPSCYMVLRPEGTAALREYLHGARVPADVYLLRKMHTEDPSAGAPTRAVPERATVQSAVSGDAIPPASASANKPQLAKAEKKPIEAMPIDTDEPGPLIPTETSESGGGQNGRAPLKSRNGVEGFLAFAEPLPPPARSSGEIPALYAWMLERDAVIPNNLVRLEEIHAKAFRDKPVARLGYEQHLLLQVAEDLGLYTTEDALRYHLSQLGGAYRRAADAYRRTESEGSGAATHALWQMASLASRLRLEAWVYRARHGEAPQLSSARQRELPLRFPGN
jgi:hypothetical protein